jgi:hypothetical protein
LKHPFAYETSATTGEWIVKLKSRRQQLQGSGEVIVSNWPDGWIQRVIIDRQTQRGHV